MARAADLNSADSQFFICFAPAPSLDGRYTIWGRVVEGMQFIDRIKAGTEEDNGIVLMPEHIKTIKVAADVK
jgi:peptidylprolyl isomerase